MWPGKTPLPQEVPCSRARARVAHLQGEPVLGRGFPEAGGDCEQSLKPGMVLGEGSRPQHQDGSSPNIPFQSYQPSVALAMGGTSTGPPVPTKPCSSTLSPWLP